MGERGVGAPPFPSLEVSKHSSSVEKSPIWARKKSPILGICPGPPRYYNLINRQAGHLLNLSSPPERPGFSLALPRPDALTPPLLLSVGGRIIPDDIGSPSGSLAYRGGAMQEFFAHTFVGLLVCLPAKSPRESPPLPLWATTHEEEDHNEPKRAMSRGCRTDPTGRRRRSPNYCWSGIC